LAARRADRSTVHRRRVAIAVLAIVLGSYVAGAVTATVAGTDPFLLAIPTATLIICAFASRAQHSEPVRAAQPASS
jgi:hypothetical protein